MKKQRFYKKLIICAVFSASISFYTNRANAAGFNISYLSTSSTTQTNINEVEKTNGNIGTIMPNYFDVNLDGTLKLASKFDPSFIQAMHSIGMKVVPFLSNHWNRKLGRNALENGNELTTEIADIINHDHLDGVNVDIENVTEIDRENYTNFIKMLRKKVPSSKVVSVAVAANPNGWKKGWYGSYDYQNLSKYADYLMVMTYDESYIGSAEGPVAGLDWVERGIQYALNQGVPNNKIVLGIPFYGRYWKEGAANGGHSITDLEITGLVKKYHGNISLDPSSSSAKAIVTIKANDPTAKVGSTILGPGTYHIWFDNAQTLKEKFALVDKYHLKGTGSWSLGQEDDSIWKGFGNWYANNQSSEDLRAFTFIDTKNHWARKDIQAIFQKRWMLGESKSYFGVDEPLTRAQVAVIFVRALGLKPVTTIQNSTFKDIQADYWAKDEVEIAKQHGIIYGDANNCFNPNMPLLREQMAVILDRIINKNVDKKSTVETSPYSDVLPNYWALKSMIRLRNQGIFNGYSDGRFGPKDIVNRAQMAVLLNRIAPIISGNVTKEYVVVAGDTLSSIAFKFNTSVKVLKEINKLTSDMIYIDQRLQVPSTSQSNLENGVQNVPQPVNKLENQTDQQGLINNQKYTVVAGDTLSKIAKIYNTTVSNIKIANNLTSDMIFIGQILLIPGNGSDSTQSFSNTLSLAENATGPDVEQLQKDLAALGYFYVNPTGYFGVQTKSAVANFQKAYQLPVTGIVDNTTNVEIDHAMVKKVIATDALNYLSIPYLWGGATPSGFDCSGFIYYLFTNHGVNLQRTSSQDLFATGKRIEKQNLQQGDLVFFAINKPGIISHVGFYLGNGKFISATSAKGIWTYSIDDRYWSKYFVGAKRIY